MTLRARLLLSAFVLSLATTLALALIVRESWHQAEADRFHAELEEAMSQLEASLQQAGPQLKNTLSPLCAHDPIVDSALVGLRSGTLGTRLLSLRTRVPELKKSLGVDELALVTSDGRTLAGDEPLPAGDPDELKEHVLLVHDKPKLRSSDKLAFEAACIKREQRAWVSLLAAIHVEPFLLRAGQAANLKLSIHKTAGTLQYDPSVLHIEERPVAALDGAILRAERSRQSLKANLAQLDSEVLSAALAALAGAFVLAFFLSRGLARPVVRFAERTRQAVQGRVEDLPVSGGPELEQAARAFNATLADLAALRQRLKVTEKIAARREVARQVAHEIKNPLSPIRTSIETLRKLKERNHEEFDAYFLETTSTVLEEVQRISNLVSHFAEYARLPSPSPKSTDVRSLVDHIAQIHRDLGASIVVEGDALPAVLADKDQVSQVLTNLLKNAIEATADASDRRIRIKVDANLDSDEVMISVHDNGPGLPQEAASQIFEPYVTTKAEGTGLGLPISQRIAVEHGGDLTYTTSELGGACFTLRLPVKGPPVLAEEGPGSTS